MTKFYKKPQGVEAVQYTGKNIDEIFNFLDFEHHKIVEENQVIFILSNGSVSGVRPTDWIIKEEDGTFSILSDKVFKETYEELK